ncbi:LysR family transcriptional regulator [Acinetobacter ursingii]|uniref:LysR family transcriptional regulator n=1 Tax=Acinetobacter TaxID=469 RepID=UPI000E6AA558|nr:MULTISPECIES: LysR family transcriptional regulator [Acinetobacter]MDG9949443.1 LysR family transcriptional regulator [Acinetobacter ursingii]MEC6126279.1 LysR family transcriptional regulator [Acinetobacter ursingii]RSC24036.1 LysR family transcriptional regulator [Acinetobacter sp. FDAARGOS_515]
MQLKSLEIFLKVVECGSFSHAATHLHTVQSNITNHIKKLEDELNCELLSRQSPIRPTSAGQQLRHYAEQMIELHQQAKFHFSDQTLCHDIPLKIGSMETTAATRLPQLFKDVLSQLPELRLHLNTGTTRELIDRVYKGDLDCAFIASSQVLPDFYNLLAWTEHLVLICPKEVHAFPDKKVLLNTPFLAIRQGCFYRKSIESFLQGYDLPPSQLTEMGNLDAILSCVHLGMGYAILPRSYIEKSSYKDALQFFDIDEQIGEINTYLIANKPQSWSGNLKHFIEQATDILAQSKTVEMT